jgi:hypothetical protein
MKVAIVDLDERCLDGIHQRETKRMIGRGDGGDEGEPGEHAERTKTESEARRRT